MGLKELRRIGHWTGSGAALRAGKIEPIEALRFVAALLVACYHLQISTSATTGTSSIFSVFDHGGGGVDIFFVISGLVIGISASRAPVFDVRTFAIRRFWRIVPFYWGVLAATIGIELLSARVGVGKPMLEAGNPYYILASALLLPIPYQIMHIAWTLTLELVFYAVFALAFAKSGLKGAMLAVLAWYLVSVAYVSTPLSQISALFYLGYPVVVEFGFGLALAWVFLNRRLPFGPVALVLGTAATLGAIFAPEQAGLSALLGLADLGREFQFGLPAALLVYGAMATPMRVPGPVMLLGKASYMLYLVHSMVYGLALAAAKILLGVDICATDAGRLALLAAAVVGSVVLCVVVEQPVLRWSRRFSAHPPSPQAAAAPVRPAIPAE
ncbi:acyltransferase 3 [Stappia sp. 22II-S9-Z10]|nr:acyltransferase 3 [Stappia sp. 22II-S9-Z10]